MPWYEHPIIFYDWVRFGEDLTPEYPQEVIQKVLDVEADTLAFCVQVGGYALWDSQVTPKAPFVGDMDLIAELAVLCRERGLRFVPWWLGTALGVERILRENPSWQLVGPPREDGTQQKHNYICYNTPYRELLYDEVREVLSAYEADGIYFDQLPGSCYCQWCQAKFERQYGRPMPIVPDEFFVYNTAAGLPPLLREFRDDCVRSFCAGIRRIIDDVRPGTCYAQNWVRNQQSYLAVGLADVLLPEFYQRDDLIPLGMKHRLTRTYLDDGPIWGNVRHSFRHDARHNPLRGTRMLLMDCVANYAAPLMLDLCAMDFDPTGKDELSETFRHIRSVQDALAQAEPVRYAALLHSRASHELQPDRYDEAFEGMYRLLLEAHVPFEIVHEAGVQRGDLRDYRALVIPDAVALADETVAATRCAVEDGLGLVTTHMTGWFDEKGAEREKPALADVFGIEIEDVIAQDAWKPRGSDPVLELPGIETEHFFHYGSANMEHPLASGLPETARFALYGDFAAISAASQGDIVGYIHAPDEARLRGRPHNRPGVFPGPAQWPLGVARECGSARVAYFAPQADATWRRAHAPELESLILRAIIWAGGPPPLEALDCPPSVEVRLFHAPAATAFHILLVNLTTNAPVRVPGGPGVLRYVTPHKGLRLALRADVEVRAIRSLLGADVQHTTEGNVVAIELAELDLYDSLTVEYA